MNHRSTRRLVPLLLLALGACGDDDAPASPDAAPATPDAAPGSPDAHVPDGCDAPITLPVDAQARTSAEAALTALAPDASFEWSDTRGTLSFASQINVALPGCEGDANAYDKMFDFLEAHAELFQIDRNDWRTDSPVACSAVTADSFTTLVIRRTHFGPLPLVNDVFHVDLGFVDGHVTVRNAGGTYIPRADAATLAKLSSCPELSAAELEPKLRAEPFAYANFDPPPAPICTLGPPGSYTAVPADTLTIGDDFQLMWDEGHAVTIYKMKAAVLRVAPRGITPELERSDANCPDDDFHPRVGWIRYFNPLTGAILGDKANPIEGCIVC